MQLQMANSIDVEAILEADSVRIRVDDGDVNPSYLFFAEYEPDSRSIRLSEHAVEQVKGVMENTHLFKNVNLRRLILAHELFHHLEAKQSDIYTRQHHAEFKRFGRFSYRTRVAAISEVAAVHFSKLVLGLAFNPAIMEILLAYSVDPDRAWSIASQLIGEEWGSYG